LYTKIILQYIYTEKEREQKVNKYRVEKGKKEMNGNENGSGKKPQKLNLWF